MWLLRHQFRVVLHRIRFPGKPMFSDAAARDLIGRRMIVGVTRLTSDGQLQDQQQFHGRIVRANLGEGIVLQQASGEELRIPPDLRALFGARRGQYRSRSTGEVVTDPDLLATWTHTIRPSGPNPNQRQSDSHSWSLREGPTSFELRLVGAGEPDTVVTVSAVLDLTSEGRLIGVEMLNVCSQLGTDCFALFRGRVPIDGTGVTHSYDSSCDAFYLRIREGRSLRQRSEDAKLELNDARRVVAIVARWNAP